MDADPSGTAQPRPRTLPDIAFCLLALTLTEDDHLDEWIDLVKRSPSFRTRYIEAFTERGRIEGLREWVLETGRARLGEPPPEIIQTVGGIVDLTRLRKLLAVTLEVKSWQELLAS